MDAITTENNPLSTKDIILRYGLIGGGVSILVTSLCYVIDYKMLFSPLAYVGVAAVIITGILAALHKKRVNNGFITYGESVSVSIGAFSIGQGIATVFGLLLYLLIDTSLVDKMRNFQLEKMDKALSAGTLKQEQYKAAVGMVEKMDSNTVLFYSIGGFLIFAILVLIVYLITSIFIKNESPFKNNPI